MGSSITGASALFSCMSSSSFCSKPSSTNFASSAVSVFLAASASRAQAIALSGEASPAISIQVRMARAAIGWGVRELAKKAGVTANTVTRIENGADAKQSTMDKLQHALEAAGIEFIDENGGGPGVRLRKRQQKRN